MQITARQTIEDQIFHPRISGFRARLVEQYHEDNPYQLADVEVIGIQGHRAVNNPFAGFRRQYAHLFEKQQKAPAFGVQSLALDIRVEAQRVVGLWRLHLVRLDGEILQPFEGLIDVAGGEASHAPRQQ